MLRFNDTLLFILSVFTYLNTSYVKVQQYPLPGLSPVEYNLNTSYVKVQLQKVK